MPKPEANALQTPSAMGESYGSDAPEAMREAGEKRGTKA
jgi:hypothetical protein